MLSDELLVQVKLIIVFEGPAVSAFSCAKQFAIPTEIKILMRIRFLNIFMITGVVELKPVSITYNSIDLDPDHLGLYALQLPLKPAQQESSWRQE
jgi:hypothetical protein